MKKLLILTVLTVVSFQFTSCKTDEKKNAVKKEVKKVAFSLETSNNSIDFTAYKTTDKIPVKGKFKKINITKNGNGSTAKGAINNAEFAIPVSSLFTSDVTRDSKLKEFFFGVMDTTSLLTGKLVLESDSTGVASITMNAVTADLPFFYSIKEKEFKLNATMNLDNWNAQNAINSLNVVCKDLHKAADGISKTWSEVDINITTIFK